MRIGASDTHFAVGTELAAAAGRTNRESAFQKLMNQSASGSGSDLDTVSLGSVSRLLQTPLLLPTANNLRALSGALNSDLTQAFEEAGISTQPPIEIRVDNGNGHICVAANRPDASQIEDKLNSDPKVAEEIRTTIAIGSHALGMQESLAFQSEYLSSDNASTVVAKYGQLFGAPQNHQTFLRFDGTSLAVLTDGES